MLFLALSPLFVFLLFAISMLVSLMLDIDPMDIKRNMNELRKCPKCLLVHRKYQKLLFQNEKECPHCHKESYEFEYKYISNYDKEAKYNYPFAPKISMFKAFQLHRAIKSNEQNEYMDKQIEQYLKIQEEQLKKMELKKDEMIKSGVLDK